jgi:N-acetylmuramoyl-L-alanine amidase
MALRSLFVFLLAGCAGVAQAADLSGMRLRATTEYTRAVFEVSGPVQYRLFGLKNPDRLVLDIDSAQLKGDIRPITEGVGVLKAVRTGRQSTGVRIVFDLNRSVSPKSFLLTPSEDTGHRLVVDLFGSGQAPSEIKTVEQVQPRADGRKVVIAIDAGHGGQDPGASGRSGLREKDVTLKIARALADLIDREPGMQAKLIRTADYFIPLRQRFVRAREAKADLFLSIHADAFSDRSVRGSSVFILSNSGASSEAANWLARSENKADLVGGVTLDDKDATLAAVLLDLSQGATLEASHDVASHVLGSLARVGKTHKRYVERAGFAVLKSPDVPSVLVETAFISNPDEERKLRDPKHRAALAQAIFKGVRSYFHSSPPPGTWLAANARADEHVVASGETLSAIATRHRISLSALRNANGLRTDTVHAGRVLRIPGA